MKHLNIYTSNHLTRLLRELAAVVAGPVADPLTPEIVVVHSSGMAHWVSMGLAEINGVCANIRFPFPNAFLEDMFALAGLEPGKRDLFERDTLTFRLMKLLPECLDHEAFDEIKGYLAEDDLGLKRYQLSGKIADTFDQYLTFRPDMIFSWEAGTDDHWQARLWRKLSGENGKTHRAALRREFFQRLTRGLASAEDFPGRVFVFGVSYLPPFHLEVLAALARHIQVNLFVLNPCREYWEDILSDREIARVKKTSGASGVSEAALHIDRGNPLLAAWGAMGRDFFSRVGGLEGEEFPLFEDEQEDTLLSCVQSDILHLRDRSRENPADPAGFPGPGSGQTPNIRIHSCYSPVRELEVLHDQLLDMFEKDPRLLPADILVMAPDIDAYAPFIEAVFDAQTDPHRKIPFTISDRRASAGNPLVEGFMTLIDMADSRFGCREVIGLLDSPGVKETFGIHDADMPRIEEWIAEVNIKWGIDAGHRKEMGLPPYEENTWRAGLDRLLLGYAMPGENRRFFAGILPCDDIEGGDAHVFGCFLEYFNRLAGARDGLLEKRTPGQWAAYLTDLIDRFFAPDSVSPVDRQVLMRALARMSNASHLAGDDQMVDRAVVKAFLADRLSGERKKGGFLSRGVTFCSMLPLRSIPAKAICLIGMNADAFPRKQYPLSFDRVAANPRPGDRIRRNDDKYLFLQALLSAGDAFFISYVGRSLYDNAEMPPATVVSDLIDYLVQGFGLRLSDLIVQHPMQAFSPRYFSGQGGLFSYSREDFRACLAADVRDRQGPHRRVFLGDALPPPEDESHIVELEELRRFFGHPSRYFLQHRLGIYFDDALWEIDESETFELTGLDRYHVEQRLMQAQEESLEYHRTYEIEKALGRLPHGNTGRAVFHQLYSDVADFRASAEEYREGPVAEPAPVSVAMEGCTVSGRVGDVYASGMVMAHCAKIRSRHLVETWISHLAWCADEKSPDTAHSVLVGKDAAWVMNRPANAHELLKALAGMYHAGMRRPPVLFPETAFAYARRRLDKNGSEQEAVTAAYQAWSGDAYRRGESEDPYYQLCFSMNAFDAAVRAGTFQENAVTVFGPILSHCRRIKRG